MKKLINFLIDQKLLANLLVVSIFIAGYYSVTNLNREAVPEVKFDMVSITTVYPGASPQEAEELISIPIEKKLRGVSDLDKVRSYNVENVSVVVVFIEDKAKNKVKTVQDIKDAVETVDNLPAGAEAPLVEEINFDNTELISLAFIGKEGKQVPYSKLREYAKISEDFFYDIDGVAEVQKSGYYDREYLVEVSPEALERNRIGLNTLANTLQTRNVDFPGGPLRIGKKEFVLRTKGQFKNADEIRNTVIRGNDTGYVLRVGDVAKVTDTYEEADVYHRFNGREAVVLTLLKKREADEIELADRVKKAVETYSVKGFEDVEIKHFKDTSEITRTRLSTVIDSAILGFFILGIFILFFLGKRMAGVVMLAMPIIFMSEFIVMQGYGMTFNILSMFGMIMVLGMIVDFSIVVTENSHRYLEHGHDRHSAVMKGVSEMFGSVTVTLICLIAAFMPLLLVSGMMGKFIKSIPMVLITSLIASWFVAFFVLPTYLYSMLGKSSRSAGECPGPGITERVICFLFRRKLNNKKEFLQEDDNFETGFFGRVQRAYKKLLQVSLKHRYITVSIMFLLLITSLSLIANVLGFQFMTEGGEEKITMRVNLPFETNLETNLTEMKKLERITMSIPSKDEFEYLQTIVGEEASSIIDPKPGKGTFKSTFYLGLCPEKDRTRTASEIASIMRQRVKEARESGTLSKDVTARIEAEFGGPPVGKPVNVEIRGKDFEVIKKIAKEYMDYLKTVKGIFDLTIDLEDGKTEYHYSVNERMAALTDVSAFDIAQALNASFSGTVATKVNEDEEEVGVRVRFEESARERMRSLSEVKIANSNGGLIGLNSVSDVTVKKSYSQINRLNYARLVQVQAEVDPSIITAVDVTKLLEKKFHDIGKRYPDYKIAYGGEQEDTNESMSELGLLFQGALLVILFTLILYFRSVFIPIVVMIAIPFALVGVVFGLMVHGQPLSFMSVLGMFSLAGVIVSNTLVLVMFVNSFRDEGMDIKTAVVEAGVVRLRPIILTAGTTILGLVPTIIGFGGKDYMVFPLALAFAYGLLFATFITLVLIPCFYHIAEDIKKGAAWLLSKIGIKLNGEIYKSRALASAEGIIPGPEEKPAQAKTRKKKEK